MSATCSSGDVAARREDAPRDVLIGISVFNRKEIVSATARSLSLADDISSAAILVIDDASSEFDSGYLASIYPPTSRIVRNATNSGMASRVTRRLMEEFLRGPESILIILDSDLITARDFLRQARSLLPLTEGLLSLFHAHTHPGTEEGPLLRKHSVGFAGTVWTRALVEEALAKVPFTIHFDNGICDYLRDKNRGIFSLKHSAVQHIGLLSGENSRFASSDFGLSFTGTEWYNLSAIHEVFLQGCQHEFQRMEKRQWELSAKSDQEIKALKQEIKLLRRGAALYEGISEVGNRGDGDLTFRQRGTAWLAKVAFALLRFSARSRVTKGPGAKNGGSIAPDRGVGAGPRC
jgi:hypothetical protein